MFLTKMKQPTTSTARQKIDSATYGFFVLDGTLWKVVFNEKLNEYESLMCFPTSKVDTLLEAYHSTLTAGHQGINKCYLTITERFICPNLAHHIRAYIMGCHICQLFKAGKSFKRPFEKRVNLNTPALSKFSMDIKYMPKYGEHKFILVLVCEVSNFMFAAPLKNTTTPEVCEAL